jgi:hypothetical protein
LNAEKGRRYVLGGFEGVDEKSYGLEERWEVHVGRVDFAVLTVKEYS